MPSTLSKEKSQISPSPSCEIITVGSELLLGQIVDTNTSYLAQELGRIGISIGFRTAVSDRIDDIVMVIRRAVERCEMVITTGGIGPTRDDLTREAVARAAGVELEFRQDLMDQVAEVFERNGFHMPENNRIQATIDSMKPAHLLMTLLVVANVLLWAVGFTIWEKPDFQSMCLVGLAMAQAGLLAIWLDDFRGV